MNADPNFPDVSADPSTPPPVPVEMEIVPAEPAPPGDPRDPQAAAIVNRHVLWSLGAGFIPVPVADLAAVTAIQMDAIAQLAKLYGVDFAADHGKRFVTALTGGAVARTGASLVKAIPGVGTIIGGLSMSAMSAASTYAVCQVAIRHFRSNGTFFNLQVERARELYQEALTKGRDFVRQLQSSEAAEAARKISDAIQDLEKLKAQGILTEEEFDSKKALALEKLAAPVVPGTAACAAPQDPPADPPSAAA